MVMGRNFAVPPPWSGHRIYPDDTHRPEDLVMLPVAMTHESSKIHVRPATRTAFIEMAEAARKNHISLVVDSGYRSVWYQRKIFHKFLEDDAEFEDIAKTIAPPGYSEHMLGRVVDLVPSDASFSRTKAYDWLEKNAHKYHFKESYPRDSKGGYAWEPWHWKYTGREGEK